MPRPLSVFSPHGLMLVHVGRNPDARVRDIAQALAMTERNVQILMRDLQSAGLVDVQRRGRRNRYRVRTRRRVGRGTGVPVRVADLLKLAATASGEGAGAAGPESAAPGTRQDRGAKVTGADRQMDWLAGNG